MQEESGHQQQQQQELGPVTNVPGNSSNEQEYTSLANTSSTETKTSNNVLSTADELQQQITSTKGDSAASPPPLSTRYDDDNINKLIDDLSQTLSDQSLDDTTPTSQPTKKVKETEGSSLLAKAPVLKPGKATLETIAKLILDGQFRNIIFMVGAGISTSAGIPDFRSPKTGLFSQLAKYNLPYPEAVFSLDFFKSNPKPFFHLARELFPGNFVPTPCHYFMRLFHDKGLLLRLYTQNIDSLERLAGIPADKLVEAHGTFQTAHCINKRCNKQYSLEWMKEIVLKKYTSDNVPRCEKCNSYVKPDITFYGEMLPDRFYICESDFSKCDLLVIMGTSLTVQPFASLVHFPKSSVPRLMINLTKPPECASIFSKHHSDRNVFVQLDTDAASRKFAEHLGWSMDLQQLIDKK